MYCVTAANTALGISSSTISPTSGFAGSYLIDSCDRPRCSPDNINCTVDKDDASLSCSLINDKTICVLAPDCQWNEKSFFNPTASCSGVVQLDTLYDPLHINATPSDIGTTTTLASGFTANLLYNKTGGNTVSLASTPLLNSDPKQCTGFGFTWYAAGTPSYNTLHPNLDVSTFTYTIMAIFGFQGDTGIPSDYKWIFTLLFTYIPLIAFALIVLMMLPV